MTEEMKRLYGFVADQWTAVMDHAHTLPSIDRQAAFWDSSVDFYEEQHPFHLEMAEFVIRALEEQGLLDCGSVLEIGCATGDLTRRLAERINSVTGMDISRAMLELARERDAAAGLSRIRRICGDFRDLDGEAGFDLVGACLVPATYSEQGLRKMTELSRKGGFFLSGCGAQDHGALIYREAGMRLLGREGQNKQDMIYPFTLLYALGKHPQIRYHRGSSVEHWERETARSKLSRYFSNVKDLPPDSDAILDDFLQERLEDGYIRVERQDCFALVTWFN